MFYHQFKEALGLNIYIVVNHSRTTNLHMYVGCSYLCLLQYDVRYTGTCIISWTSLADIVNIKGINQHYNKKINQY